MSQSKESEAHLTAQQKADMYTLYHGEVDRVNTAAIVKSTDSVKVCKETANCKVQPVRRRRRLMGTGGKTLLGEGDDEDDVDSSFFQSPVFYVIVIIAVLGLVAFVVMITVHFLWISFT